MINKIIIFSIFLSFLQFSEGYSRDLLLYYDMNNQDNPEAQILDSSGNSNHAVWIEHPDFSQPSSIIREDNLSYLDLSDNNIQTQDKSFLTIPNTINFNKEGFIFDIVFRLPHNYNIETNRNFEHVLFENTDTHCNSDENENFSLYLKYDEVEGFQGDIWSVIACVNLEENKTASISYSWPKLEYGQWYQATLIYDGTELQLYINKELKAKTKRKGRIKAASDFQFVIGSRRPSNQSWHAAAYICPQDADCVGPKKQRKSFWGHIASIGLWSIGGAVNRENLLLEYAHKEPLSNRSDFATNYSHLKPKLYHSFDYPPSLMNNNIDTERHSAYISGHEVNFNLLNVDWIRQGGRNQGALQLSENSRVSSSTIQDISLMTLSFWFKPQIRTETKEVLSFQSRENSFLNLGLDPGGSLFLKAILNHSGNIDLVSDVKVKENQWNHVVISFSGIHLSLYLNGVLVSEQSFIEDQLLSSDFKIVFGNLSGDSNSIQATLDDILVLSQATSLHGIQSLFKLRAEVPEVSHYSFDHSYGSNNNTGLLSNSIQTRHSNDSNFGLYGQALEFGRSSETSVAFIDYKQDTLNLKEEFSLGFYFYTYEDKSLDQSLLFLETNNNKNLRIYLDKNETLKLLTNNDRNQKVKMSSPVRSLLNQWESVFLVYDGIDLILYHNGSPVDSQHVGPNYNLDISKIYLASYPPNLQRPNVLYYEYSGLIDELSLFDRKLTEDEVTKKHQPFRLSRVNPISDRRSFPESALWNRWFMEDQGLQLKGVPSEVITASFLLERNRLNSRAIEFDISVSDLISSDRRIPSESISMRYVKVWYQGEHDQSRYHLADQGIYYGAVGDDLQDQREAYEKALPVELKPELLLHNPDLISLDKEKEDNLVWNKRLSQYAKEVSINDVFDAHDILPVQIEAGHSQQYWLEITVPDDAEAGIYEGNITLSWNGDRYVLPLNLEINSLDLDESRIKQGIYYRSGLNVNCRRGNNLNRFSSHDNRNEVQYRAEILNMKSHGVDYPSLYHCYNDEEDLDRIIEEMEVRQELGLSADRVAFLGVVTSYNCLFKNSCPDSEAIFENLIRTTMTSFIENDFPKPYFYISDEPDVDNFEGHVRKTRYIQSICLDLENETHCAKTAMGGNYRYFKNLESQEEGLASVIDWPILSLGAQEAVDQIDYLLEGLHEDGNELWAYAHPQSGLERPFLYRKKMGLWLWAYGIDGNHTYAYQASYAQPWNDRDFSDELEDSCTNTQRTNIIKDCKRRLDRSKGESCMCTDLNNDPEGYLYECSICRRVPRQRRRDQMMTYPTANGVIDTIQWSGYREGVIDLKYMSSYLNQLDRLRERGGFPDLIHRSEVYLEELRQAIKADQLDEFAYQEIRRGLRQRIQNLNEILGH